MLKMHKQYSELALERRNKYISTKLFANCENLSSLMEFQIIKRSDFTFLFVVFQLIYLYESIFDDIYDLFL